MSAGAGQILTRDPATGVFTATTIATQAREVFDPFTGNRVFVNPDASGFVTGKGVDANGFPNPDIYFGPGGFTVNPNGSITITPLAPRLTEIHWTRCLPAVAIY